MAKAVPSVGVVILSEGGDYVLMVRHEEGARQRTGVLGLPSGTVEPGETLTEAALRELSEETGLETTVRDLIHINVPLQATIETKGGPVTYEWTVYLVERFWGDLRPNSETTPLWLEVSEVLALDESKLMPNVQHVVGLGRRIWTSRNLSPQR